VFYFREKRFLYNRFQKFERKKQTLLEILPMQQVPPTKIPPINTINKDCCIALGFSLTDSTTLSPKLASSEIHPKNTELIRNKHKGD
jgi:hypothetical protein